MEGDQRVRKVSNTEQVPERGNSKRCFSFQAKESQGTTLSRRRKAPLPPSVTQEGEPYFIHEASNPPTQPLKTETEEPSLSSPTPSAHSQPTKISSICFPSLTLAAPKSKLQASPPEV